MEQREAFSFTDGQTGRICRDALLRKAPQLGERRTE